MDEAAAGHIKRPGSTDADREVTGITQDAAGTGHRGRAGAAGICRENSFGGLDDAAAGHIKRAGPVDAHTKTAASNRPDGTAAIHNGVSRRTGNVTETRGCALNLAARRDLKCAGSGGANRVQRIAANQQVAGRPLGANAAHVDHARPMAADGDRAALNGRRRADDHGPGTLVADDQRTFGFQQRTRAIYVELAHDGCIEVADDRGAADRDHASGGNGESPDAGAAYNHVAGNDHLAVLALHERGSGCVDPLSQHQARGFQRAGGDHLDRPLPPEADEHRIPDLEAGGIVERQEPVSGVAAANIEAPRRRLRAMIEQKAACSKTANDGVRAVFPFSTGDKHRAGPAVEAEIELIRQ